MKREIGVKDVCLAVGGLLTGITIMGFGVRKAKKQIRKEFVDENSKRIKDEILSEIRAEVKKHDIVEEVIDATKKDIINDILEESRNDITDIQREMRDHFNKTTSTIKSFERTLKEIKEEVLNYDARIGAIIRNSALSVISKVAGRGDDFEIEI